MSIDIKELYEDKQQLISSTRRLARSAQALCKLQAVSNSIDKVTESCLSIL